MYALMGYTLARPIHQSIAARLTTCCHAHTRLPLILLFSNLVERHAAAGCISNLMFPLDQLLVDLVQTLLMIPLVRINPRHTVDYPRTKQSHEHDTEIC